MKTANMRNYFQKLYFDGRKNDKKVSTRYISREYYFVLLLFVFKMGEGLGMVVNIYDSSQIGGIGKRMAVQDTPVQKCEILY